MLQLIRSAIIWSLCIVYSVFAAYKLFIIYVTKFLSQPWKPKDRPNAPACLSDPKYGIHRYATINGLKLHYVEAGDRNKPLMLFVHGFPEFWYCWRHQITEFSKDYWTVAIDLRGYNLSERPIGLGAYKLQDIVDDLRALIEHLNRKQCILICHDWGAIIGWQFVAQYKHMVQKYVMMGGPSRRVFRKLFMTTLDQFKRSWYILFFQVPILPELLLSADDFASFFHVWNDQFNEGFTEKDLEAYKHVFSRPGALTAGINYYRTNFSIRSRPEPTNSEENHLDGSDGMYVLGQYEKYISAGSLDLTAKSYPKIRVEVIAGANHFLQQHAPKATNDLIWDFLGSADNYPVQTFT